MNINGPMTKGQVVALRKESVDRNDVIRPAIDVFLAVALRKESVDRNVFLTLTVRNVPMSLSARRAWIEIIIHHAKKNQPGVALRKESVDRNTRCASHRLSVPLSLSARRAWIEMLLLFWSIWR